MRIQLPPKGTQPPIFGPSLLWPNGWTDQDATWYEGRPWCKRHCVTWGPISPLPKRGAEPPIFGPWVLCQNGSLDQDVTWYDGRPRPRQHCVRWGPNSPSQKGHSPPNFRPMSIVAKWSPISATAEHLLKNNVVCSHCLLTFCTIMFLVTEQHSKIVTWHIMPQGCLHRLGHGLDFLCYLVFLFSFSVNFLLYGMKTVLQCKDVLDNTRELWRLLPNTNALVGFSKACRQ